MPLPTPKKPRERMNTELADSLMGIFGLKRVTGKQYMAQVAALGCLICRRNGYRDTPAEVHHPRTGAGVGRRSSDFETIPLCPYHHRSSNEALHVMGRKAWERHHGVTESELTAQTRALLYGE